MLKLYNDACIFYNMRLFDELKRAHSLGTPNASKLYGIFILPLAQDGFERALRCGRVEGCTAQYISNLSRSKGTIIITMSTSSQVRTWSSYDLLQRRSVQSDPRLCSSLSLSILHMHQHAPHSPDLSAHCTHSRFRLPPSVRVVSRAFRFIASCTHKGLSTQRLSGAIAARLYRHIQSGSWFGALEPPKPPLQC
jgi:hypothetical protein